MLLEDTSAPTFQIIPYAPFQIDDSQVVVSEAMPDTSRVVIAVMGMTGAGKSSFIQRVTGQNEILVEDSLSSGTEEVKSYDFTHETTKFTLVDTPGFDDSRSSDQVVIEKILAWLHKSYVEGTQLNGLVFIHRITDPKMSGTALSNLRMFRQLCGPDCLKNVILATSFWGSVEDATRIRREKELINNDQFWGRMVAKGSKVVRLNEDRSDNLKVLLKIAKNNGKVVVGAQEEMLAGKSASETSAAQEVSREWKQLKHEKEQELARESQKLQAEMERRKSVQRALLEQNQLEVQERIRKAQEEAADEEMERQRARVHRQLELKAQLERERQQEVRKQQQAQEALRAEEAAQARRVEEIRRQYYRNHVCYTAAYKRGWCDRCGKHIPSETRYYHCCFCKGDNYDHCLSCGRRCGDSDHPIMKLRRTRSDCIVM